jgi:hypothetical protein
MPTYRRRASDKPPWWKPAMSGAGAIALSFVIGGTSWLTSTVVNLDKASDNGPLMREYRDKTDARNDANVTNDLNDIRARLGRLESKDCTR